MVIISNGHSKFILATAAVEAHHRAVLDGYITAGYPTPAIKRTIRALRLDRAPSAARLLAREETLPSEVVHPLWAPELIGQLAALARRYRMTRSAAEHVEALALKLYGYEAARTIERSGAKIYHFRSGYGQTSVQVAKRRGMIALCDHSIVHPAVLQYLIDHRGKLPPPGYRGPMSPLWTNVLRDIDQSDYVLVNSEFVRDTFVNQGWSPERIRVAYTGVDQQFLDAIPARDTDERDAPVRLLFAGDFGSRKGADVLVEALSRVDDLPWQLEIIGTIAPEVRAKAARFLADPRVSTIGYIPRLQLAERMTKADLFVFPSLAEGSARVVFMAMACGCYVITTPNSGSVTVDRINGALVPAGDADALETELRDALTNRAALRAVGRENARLVATAYRQSDYGRALLAIYAELLASS